MSPRPRPSNDVQRVLEPEPRAELRGPRLAVASGELRQREEVGQPLIRIPVLPGRGARPLEVPVAEDVEQLEGLNTADNQSAGPRHLEAAAEHEVLFPIVP
jgi:hypothetical protein